MPTATEEKIVATLNEISETLKDIRSMMSTAVDFYCEQTERTREDLTNFKEQAKIKPSQYERVTGCDPLTGRPKIGKEPG
jgi:hypothetical protein